MRLTTAKARPVHRATALSATVLLALAGSATGAGAAQVPEPAQMRLGATTVEPGQPFLVDLPGCSAEALNQIASAKVTATNPAAVNWDGYTSVPGTDNAPQTTFNMALAETGEFILEGTCLVGPVPAEGTQDTRERIQYGTATITVAAREVPPEPAATDTLAAGQELTAGKAIVAAGGAKLVMQTDGNLVGYDAAGAALWSSATFANPGAKAVLQADGNFVVYSAAGKALWHSATFGNPTAKVTVKADGVVELRAGDKLLWSTAPVTAKNVLAAGQKLSAGSELVSRNGKFTLAMQTDGNLVLYSGSTVLWAANSYPAPGGYTVIQSDGNVVVYNAAGNQARWQSGTRAGTTLAVQDDGNVVLYGSDGKPSWWTGTGRA